MKEVSVNDIFSIFGRLIENKIVFIFISIFLSIDIILNYSFQKSILELNISWIQQNFNVGQAISLFFLYVFLYFIVLPAFTSIYNYLIARIIILSIKLKIYSSKSSTKKIYIDFIKQFAVFKNNWALLEFVKEEEKKIDNWFQEREVYLMFIIISSIYLFFPSSTLKSYLLILIGTHKDLEILYYALFILFLLFILVTKTLQPPDRHLYIVSEKQIEEINNYLNC